MDIKEEIRERLFSLRDEEYRDFNSKLIPTVAKDSVIGVRTPGMRKLAKEYAARPDIESFLKDLPHKYYDENNLHGFIISLGKNYYEVIENVEQLLPYIDNWATCDMMSPKAFGKNKDKLIKSIESWLMSKHEYTVRFGIVMLMTHYLGDDYKDIYSQMVSNVRRDEYYIKMAQAWYFATALTKNYEKAVPYIEERMLDKWTHNKAIQKACESFRVRDEQKAYLKTLNLK